MRMSLVPEISAQNLLQHWLYKFKILKKKLYKLDNLKDVKTKVSTEIS